MLLNFRLYVHAAAFILNYLLHADILNARKQVIEIFLLDDSFGVAIEKVLRFFC